MKLEGGPTSSGTFAIALLPEISGIKVAAQHKESGSLDTGTAEILVTEKRHEPFDLGCFTHAGVDPAIKRYILIKSRQHFRAGFEPILKHVIMVSGPGITTSDYSLYPWNLVRRPIYPLDHDTVAELPRRRL